MGIGCRLQWTIDKLVWRIVPLRNPQRIPCSPGFVAQSADFRHEKISDAGNFLPETRSLAPNGVS